MNTVSTLLFVLNLSVVLFCFTHCELFIRHVKSRFWECWDNQRHSDAVIVLMLTA